MSGSGWVSWVLSGVGLVLVATSCGGTKNDAPAAQLSGNAGADATAGGSDSVAGGAGAAPARSPGKVNGLLWLGSACDDATDCGDQGLRCLSGDEDFMDGQGAPGGGLCTTDCKTDEDCRAFDASAVCATLAEAPLVLAYAAKTVQRLCVQGCTLGAPSGATKCQGRSDLACRPFAPDHPATCFLKGEVCPEGTLCYRGVCRELGCGPRCNADKDCSAGRHCNPFTGLCDVEAAVPVPVGAECDTNAQATNCGGGNCLEVDDVDGTRIKRMCTQSCTIGKVCGDGSGACVWPRFENFATGDAGYCVQRCNCDSDCVNAVDRCLPWGDLDTEKAYGSRGACEPPSEGVTTLTCDDAAGASGAGGAPSLDAGAGGAR